MIVDTTSTEDIFIFLHRKIDSEESEMAPDWLKSRKIARLPWESPLLDSIESYSAPKPHARVNSLGSAPFLAALSFFVTTGEFDKIASVGMENSFCSLEASFQCEIYT